MATKAERDMERVMMAWANRDRIVALLNEVRAESFTEAQLLAEKRIRLVHLPEGKSYSDGVNAELGKLAESFRRRARRLRGKR